MPGADQEITLLLLIRISYSSPDRGGDLNYQLVTNDAKELGCHTGFRICIASYTSASNPN